jgi:hypothetical protein
MQHNVGVDEKSRGRFEKNDSRLEFRTSGQARKPELVKRTTMKPEMCAGCLFVSSGQARAVRLYI